MTAILPEARLRSTAVAPEFPFSDFLENEQSYRAREEWWLRLVAEVESAAGQAGQWKEWMAQPPVERDGNPICSVKSDRLRRAFRVIQWAPEREAADAFGGWVDVFDDPS